jgi:hypothetical protein
MLDENYVRHKKILNFFKVIHNTNIELEVV